MTSGLVEYSLTEDKLDLLTWSHTPAAFPSSAAEGLEPVSGSHENLLVCSNTCLTLDIDRAIEIDMDR